MRLFLTLLLFALATALAPLAHADARPAILIVGDSLSAGYGLRPGQGWVTLLERRLQREGYGYRVVNASVTGETTDGGLARLPRALDLHRPKIVVIELGGNDGLRGLKVERVRRNLDAMIQASRAAGAEVLLAGIRIPTNYGPRYTDSLQSIYPELSTRYRIALAPFLLEGVALRDELFQPDGIHPNAEAQALLLGNIWPALQPLLKR